MQKIRPDEAEEQVQKRWKTYKYIPTIERDSVEALRKDMVVSGLRPEMDK